MTWDLPGAHKPRIDSMQGRYVASCPDCGWYVRAGTYPTIVVAANEHRAEATRRR